MGFDPNTFIGFTAQNKISAISSLKIKIYQI